VSKLSAAGASLIYSTYLGGSGIGANGDLGASIAVDSLGSVYVTGFTYSTDFPITSALQTNNRTSANNRTAFVSKIGAALSAGSAVQSDPQQGLSQTFGLDAYSPQTGALQAQVPLDFLEHAPT
jgi:hypothetical protein